MRNWKEIKQRGLVKINFSKGTKISNSKIPNSRNCEIIFYPEMDFVKSNRALPKARPYHLFYTLDVNLFAKDILPGRFMLENLFLLNLVFFLAFPLVELFCCIISS